MTSTTLTHLDKIHGFQGLLDWLHANNVSQPYAVAAEWDWLWQADTDPVKQALRRCVARRVGRELSAADLDAIRAYALGD